MRLRREAFIGELLRDLTVYPYTRETAMLAGKIDGEQQSQGVTIPFGDLLIGATAFRWASRSLRSIRAISG